MYRTQCGLVFLDINHNICHITKENQFNKFSHEKLEIINTGSMTTIIKIYNFVNAFFAINTNGEIFFWGIYNYKHNIHKIMSPIILDLGIFVIDIICINNLQNNTDIRDFYVIDDKSNIYVLQSDSDEYLLNPKLIPVTINLNDIYFSQYSECSIMSIQYHLGVVESIKNLSIKDNIFDINNIKMYTYDKYHDIIFILCNNGMLYEIHMGDENELITKNINETNDTIVHEISYNGYLFVISTRECDAITSIKFIEHDEYMTLATLASYDINYKCIFYINSIC